MLAFFEKEKYNCSGGKAYGLYDIKRSRGKVECFFLRNQLLLLRWTIQKMGWV